MALNKQAMQIRSNPTNETIYPSGLSAAAHAERAQKLQELKANLGYVKDTQAAQEKYNRWKDILSMAGDQNSPDFQTQITTFKERMYEDEEMLTEPKFSTEGGVTALEKKFAHNPDYKNFFDAAKASAEGEIDGKSYNLVALEDKDNEVRNEGSTSYVTGNAINENMTTSLFSSKEEALVFIDKFPGANRREKIFSMITYFGFKKAGTWDTKKNEIRDAGERGSITLTAPDAKGNVFQIWWTDHNAGVTAMNANNGYPVFTSK